MSRQRSRARFPLVATGTAVLAALLALLASAGTSAADPSRDDWARLRECESSGQYSIVASHGGYYGAYQFDLPTWRSVGGSGYPHEASVREQDYRALYLYRMRGWQPWTCAGDLGLREDADAGSERVPTYAESAYISGEADGVPPWPGVVFDRGDCHPSLRTWQLRMNTHGFDFQGSGCYHGETRRAVLALQRANGINPSGLLGPRTWRAAWQGNPARP